MIIVHPMRLQSAGGHSSRFSTYLLGPLVERQAHQTHGVSRTRLPRLQDDPGRTSSTYYRQEACRHALPTVTEPQGIN